jgi:hypothetical protein
MDVQRLRDRTIGLRTGLGRIVLMPVRMSGAVVVV